MARILLPVLACAALLGWRLDAAPRPRVFRRGGHATDHLDRLPSGWTPGAPLGDRREPPDAGAEPPEGRAAEAERPSEPCDPRLHDVRDLVALGFSIEHLALLVEHKCRRAKVVPRVNVLEVLAPDGTQLEVERLLDARRADPHVVRIHPVADLVTRRADLLAAQDPADAALFEGEAGSADEEPEPTEPFAIDSLADVMLQTIEGVGTIDARGANLVVLATPRAQVSVSEFLDDLRKP